MTANSSWVLILSPQRAADMPAVIGGYTTREEAVNAGRQAMGDEEHEDPARWFTAWRTFVVIPGAAGDPPSPMTVRAQSEGDTK